MIREWKATDVSGRWLEQVGFVVSEIGGVPRHVFYFPSDTDGCRCELHVLADAAGAWIVEMHNSQSDHEAQRVAFPGLFTTRRQIQSLLNTLCSTIGETT